MDNKQLTWNEFANLPIVGHEEHRDVIRIVEHADELVTLAKAISEIVGILRIGGAGRKVDFLGCSHSYVIEKVKLAINDLEWISRRVKEIKQDS